MKWYSLQRSYLVPLTFLAVLAFVLGVVYLDPGTGNTQTAEPIKSAPQDIPADEPVARVASVLSPSVVQINVSGVQQTPLGTQRDEGIGSGVIYRSDGYIITNNHVVEDSRDVEVAFADGSTEQGQVVGTDPTTDVAVVKVDRDNLPAAIFADRDPIVGQMAVAVGSPSGFESTVTSGIVSGTGREVPAQLTGGRQENSLVDLIQTDAADLPRQLGRRPRRPRRPGHRHQRRLSATQRDRRREHRLRHTLADGHLGGGPDHRQRRGRPSLPRRLPLRPYPGDRAKVRELRRDGRARRKGRARRSRRPGRNTARRHRDRRGQRRSPELGRPDLGPTQLPAGRHSRAYGPERRPEGRLQVNLAESPQ